MIREGIRIEGKVQGVFFRASAKKIATNLGLTGFVRNEPDGSVYAEAEGAPKALEEFKSWCLQGPDLAKVENVFTENKDLKGDKDFIIEK